MKKWCNLSILLFWNYLGFVCVIGHEKVPRDIDLSSDSNLIISLENDQEKFAAITSTGTPAQQKSRRNRQVFFDPTNFVILQNFGIEGSKCITSQGLGGVCVGFGSCRQQQYFRWKRQLAFVELRQWRKPALTLGTEICNFLDPYGRANSGICCTYDFQNGNGIDFGPSFMIPGGVRPIPAPPEATEANQPPLKDEGEEDTQTLENPNHEPPQSSTDDQSFNNNNTELDDTSPDFVDENNVPYDPVRDDGDINLLPAVTYDDYRYQWPTQPGTQFSGITEIHQWPPPIPTHPPAIGSWPPPLPTHPPGHHYPTHPPSPAFTTRPTTTTTPITTRRTTTTTRRPITTKSTKRPSYPAYPGGYPTYPTYPTQRPIQTTTTRNPVSSSGNGGTNEYGLPLQCGIKNAVSRDQERIVGGTNASPHEFPWMAVLFKSGKQFCGGSLITKSHILTAAHCVARMTTWDVAALTAHLGDYNIRTDYEVKHVVRRIKRLVRHKGFDFSHLHNDIAVLTLSEPVKFTHEIQPICLPTSPSHQGRSYSGHVGIVAGWGSLRENGPQPSILQKVQIPIWTNYDCARKYGSAAPGGIIESMLCAGQAARDSCSGDSGGPMIVNENGRYVQVGIVSWGIGCGKGQYPGVYTRVTSLLPWIYKNIK